MYPHQTENQDDGENSGSQKPLLNVSGTSTKTYQRRAECAAGISGQSKESKECGTAFGDTG